MTIFVRGDYLMEKRDAAILAGRIRAYWHARGHNNVTAWSEQIPPGEVVHSKRVKDDDNRMINKHAMYQVRSNLINGLPPRD